jgi:hypothetical protein
VVATIPAPKHRVLVLDCASRDLMTCLHFAKCSDVVVIVINVAQGEEYTYDDDGSAFLTSFKAQGMPAVIGLFQGLELVPPKRQSEMRRYAHRSVTLVTVASPSGTHVRARSHTHTHRQHSPYTTHTTHARALRHHQCTTFAMVSCEP